MVFKKAELNTGEIVETLENFKGPKPRFILENEIDINELHLKKRKEELINLKKVEEEQNAKIAAG